MEKSLSLNPEHATLYKHQIDSMVARGVAHKISKEEMSSYDGPFYYISHHAVLKPSQKVSLAVLYLIVVQAFMVMF